jgi:transcription antitermination factor NusG
VPKGAVPFSFWACASSAYGCMAEIRLSDSYPTSLASMTDWALATTPPNAEHLVSADLRDRGYPHWLFKRRSTRVWHGRIVLSMPAAFPRYVMIPIELCWEIMRDVWRVLGIVCFGENVARVREREVQQLVERCGGGDVLPAEVVPEPFLHGERVHVGGTGLIAGHDAVYNSVTEDGKLRLSFDFLGRLVPIDVDKRDVFSISKKTKRRRRHRPGRRHRKAA